MRVIHVAPTQFGRGGLLGGGERYPLELARALAAEIDCRLVSFGPRPLRYREPGGLRVREIGRASGRERVEISVVAVSLKKKKNRRAGINGDKLTLHTA